MLLSMLLWTVYFFYSNQGCLQTHWLYLWPAQMSAWKRTSYRRQSINYSSGSVSYTHLLYNRPVLECNCDWGDFTVLSSLFFAHWARKNVSYMFFKLFTVSHPCARTREYAPLTDSFHILRLVNCFFATATRTYGLAWYRTDCKVLKNCPAFMIQTLFGGSGHYILQLF